MQLQILSESQLERWNHVRERAGVVESLTMDEALKALASASPATRSKVLEYLEPQ